MTVRVLVVDDERLIRAGYRMILRTEPGIDVVGEAGDGAEAVLLARRLHPDVVLVDVRMPRMDGITATTRLLSLDPAPAVLVVTTFDLDEYVYEALRVGASGFLLKDAPEEQLVEAIRVAPTGVSMIAPDITRRLIEKFAPRTPSPRDPRLEQLTERETDVLMLLARGMSNAEIAAALVVGEATVKTHVSRVLFKLALTSRTQAVVLAYESGLVVAGPPAARGPVTEG